MTSESAEVSDFSPHATFCS